MLRTFIRVVALSVAFGSPALAQDLPVTTTIETTKSTDGPYGSDRTATTRETVRDANGNEVMRDQTVHSGDGSLSVTSGTQTRHTVVVPPTQTSTSASTTTTVDHH